MKGQFLGGKPIDVSYSFKKEGGVAEKHGGVAERVIAQASLQQQLPSKAKMSHLQDDISLQEKQK